MQELPYFSLPWTESFWVPSSSLIFILCGFIPKVFCIYLVQESCNRLDSNTLVGL
jgi:hypothetical protein